MVNFLNFSSSTFKSSGNSVSVTYTQGYWKGVLGEDRIHLPPLGNASITVNIACINSSTNFFINGSQWQGILGLAYEHIAKVLPFQAVLTVVYLYNVSFNKKI